MTDRASRAGVAVECQAATFAQAHLTEIQNALEQAQSCILGETPEHGTPEEARADTLHIIREALLNHVPPLRMRLG